MKGFLHSLGWIGMYFMIPLIPFFIGGLLTYFMRVETCPDNYTKSVAEFLRSFDYCKLLFAIFLIGIFLEKNIRSYAPIIPSEKPDKNGVRFCRIAYFSAIALWSVLLFCNTFVETTGYTGFHFFSWLFSILSMMLFLYSLIIIFVVKTSYKF